MPLNWVSGGTQRHGVYKVHLPKGPELLDSLGNHFYKMSINILWNGIYYLCEDQ